MKLDRNKIYYNYDDILLGCQNLDQLLNWFAKKYKRLNKTKRDQLKCRYENTYMAGIIEQLENEIKEKRKIKRAEKVNEE